MARHPTPPPATAPSLTPTQALEKLRAQLETGHEMASIGAAPNGYEKWLRESNHWVEQAFGENSSKARDFWHEGQPMSVSTGGPREQAAQMRSEVAAKVLVLRSYVSILEQEGELAMAKQGVGVPTAASASRKVFVVHGHDVAAREAVARFLEKLELEPIVLSEQENGGLTIIEKFEKHAGESAFAVVLLTPDDVGASAKTPANLKGRARQNVVLELGYFYAKLGRGHVCALSKGDIERPSDIDGVLYVALSDDGAWHLPLSKELKAAFPDLDMNRLLQT